MNGKRNQQTSEALEYKTYLSCRENYDKAELEMSGRYDQWILTLAGGGLGVSLTFLEKIAPNPNHDSVLFLKIAWACLVVALFTGLTSFLTSQYAVREQRHNLDCAMEGRDTVHRRKFSAITTGLNWTALIAFICGALFLCLFSVANIPAPQDKPAGSQPDNTVGRQSNVHGLGESKKKGSI